MLEHIIGIGVLLLMAPVACIALIKASDYDEYREECITVMLIQGIMAIVLILIGIGASLNRWGG